MSRNKFFAFAIIVVFVFGVTFFVKNKTFFENNSTFSLQEKQVDIGAPTKPNPNSDPMSLIVLVNKQYPLSPADFYPKDLIKIPGGESLRAPASEALEEMSNAAYYDGVSLMISSSFRSYQDQVELYNEKVRSIGEANANAVAAKPGSSEHQTGLAVDLVGSLGCSANNCPENTLAWEWLAKNAHNFGFILRYPKGYENVTGYDSEAWHYRFVGIEVAKKMKNNNIATFEQFVLG